MIAGMMVMMMVALAGVLGLWLRSEHLLALTRRQAVGLQLDQAIALCEQGYVDRGLLAMAGQLQEYGTSPPAEQHAIRANLASWSTRLIAPEMLAARIAIGGLVPGTQGKLFATVGEDSHPQVWDLATGKPVGNEFEPIGPVRKASPGAIPDKPYLWFSDDGKVLIARGGDGWCRLWNVDTGRLLGPPIDAGTAMGRLLDCGSCFDVRVERRLSAAHDASRQCCQALGRQDREVGDIPLATGTVSRCIDRRVLPAPGCHQGQGWGLSVVRPGLGTDDRPAHANCDQEFL